MFFLKQDIRNLNKQLEQIKSCDTNARLTTATSDKDIADMCNSMNAVLDERRKAVIEAQIRNTEFKQAISNISHDLRTPLTSAIGYLQLAIQSGDLEHIALVEERLKSLTTLMNSLFEYTKLIEGRAELALERVNLCNIIRDVAAQFYDGFTAKGYDVNLDIPSKPVYAICDKSSAERVMQNLVKNALEHGHKRFELALNDSEIIIRNCVEKISTLNVERIFERFYTADLSRASGNTGLGLAIAKELTESMGWRVEAAKKCDMLEIKIRF